MGVLNFTFLLHSQVQYSELHSSECSTATSRVPLLFPVLNSRMISKNGD